MKINPYLHFNGTCAEAFKFYEKILGGKIQMAMPFGDHAPSPDWKDKIMHSGMTVGDITLMGTDAPPQYFQKPEGFRVSLAVDLPAEADRIFSGLSDGGTVDSPIQETFFAKRFGMVTDKFGTPWMVMGGQTN